MNIDVKPVLFPQYTRTIGKTFEAWTLENLSAIGSFWIDLGALASESLSEFAECQFDAQAVQDEQDRPDDLDVRSDEAYEELKGREIEEDGECFRGGEAEAFLAEEQARIQRELK